MYVYSTLVIARESTAAATRLYSSSGTSFPSRWEFECHIQLPNFRDIEITNVDEIDVELVGIQWGEPTLLHTTSKSHTMFLSNVVLFRACRTTSPSIED